MRSKNLTLAGAIIASAGLFTEVLNEWLQHFFYAVYKIAESAPAAGTTTSPPYTTPENVHIFMFTRIFIWLFIAFGVFLVVWGFKERIDCK